jgi:7-carboxy-7-deazaguanine synthase
MKTAPIVEIFRSLEGEGYAVGTPTIFIRFAGCNVGCVHCDSKQTWSTEGFPQMTVGDIIAEVERLNVNKMINRLSITGGEPFEHLEFLINLCTGLILRSLDVQGPEYEINVETSGTIFPQEIFNTGDLTEYFNTISIDIKTPSSGVKLGLKEIESLRNVCRKANVYTKAVIAAPIDLEFVLDTFDGLLVNDLILTPCEIDGKFFSVEKIYEVLDRRNHCLFSQPLRIIAQQHKTQGYR